MATERSAGAIIYRITAEGDLRFLLLQAALGKPWGFPKGKLDRGETEEQAARREIAEEAGLQEIAFAPDFRYVVRYTFRRGRVLIRKDVVYFLARTDNPDVQISWEHVAFRWAPLDEALELVNYENAREALRRANAHIHQHR